MYEIGVNSRILVSDPDYRTKISKGIDATNPYQRIEWILKREAPTVYVGEGVNGNKSYSVRGITNFHQIPSYQILQGGMTDATLRDIALGRLKNRLANEIKAYKALAPTAELREARKLFRSVSSRVIDFLMALARAKKSKGKSLSVWASGQWLEVSFAIKPMVADISNLLDTVYNYMLRRDRSIRLQGSSGKQWIQTSYRDRAGTTTGCLGANISTNYRVEASLQYRFICGFEVLLESASDYGWTEHLGIELSEVPSAAWELTAFSWMFDYFTTVGAFLGDVFDVPPGFTKYVVENRRYKARIYTEEFYMPQPWLKTIVTKSGSALVELVVFERKRLTKLPTRALRFKTLDEIGVNGVNRLLNLAAVLQQQFK